jgi:hypothetical protein
MATAEDHSTRWGWRNAGPRRHAGRRQTSSSSTATGLRRVDWVRLVVDDDQVRAEAVGVGYRLPATRPIPLSVARALMAEGTPSVMHRVGSHSAYQMVHPDPADGRDVAR